MKQFLIFSRPHTIIGTTLSIVTLFLLAMGYSDFSDWHLDIVLLSLISCLGANIYIVGLNQITDVGIDKINKPYLPLASGAYSLRTGYIIVGASLLVSLLIAFLLGRYLLLTVLLSLVLGTMYSLPPFRLKRFYFWAAFCIIAVRGVIVNLLLFLHFNDTVNGLSNVPVGIWLLTATIFVYSVAIAWFKDIPDMEGDQRFQIYTLTLRLGAKKVFLIGNALIGLTFLALLVIPLVLEMSLSAPVLIIAHAVFLVLLILAGRRVNLTDKTSVFAYYQFIWVLFFLEYVAFAVAGLLN